MALKLEVYDIIKGPVISDKAYRLNRQLNQLVLNVHVKATKPMIKDALEKLFDVKVDAVRTTIRSYKKGRGISKKYKSTPKITKDKIAFITLAQGYSLDLFEQAGIPSVAADDKKKADTTQDAVSA